MKLEDCFLMADSYQTINIGADFKVRIDNRQSKPDLMQTDEREIEAIWQADQKRKGVLLFNGTILSAQSYDAKVLRGRWISYREALAAYRSPSLANRLNYLPVAVSGLIKAGSQVLFAERASTMTQYPGYLELAPSGGIDTSCASGSDVDYRRLLLKELLEETGIPSSQVLRLLPFALMRERDMAALEICVAIEVNPTLSSDLRSLEAEYRRFFWVQLNEIDEFLLNWNGPVVPLSLALLRHQKLRKGRQRASL